MRIGIDGRLYGLEHAGIGRYVTELVSQVLKQDKENEYVLFLTAAHAKEFQGSDRLRVVVTGVPIYGFLEQLILPFVFAKEKLDLLHVPHFNAPLLYPGKFILTIHDLIKHESKGKRTTTHQPWLYQLKRLGYLFLTYLITRRASHIVVPSQFVKNDVVDKLAVSAAKISVTYEAVSGGLKKVSLGASEKKEILSKHGLSQPFVVYTGSTYPHKNVELLVDAVIKHNKVKEADLQLALIGARPIFWERMKQTIEEKEAEHFVKLLGFESDSEVSKIYSLALALVHPSKMEGFGLTGLEAMSVGLPVISSSASCLPEVYGEAALYFDPSSVDDLVNRFGELIGDVSIRSKLAAAGIKQAGKYSWSKMGKENISIYNSLR